MRPLLCPRDGSRRSWVRRRFRTVRICMQRRDRWGAIWDTLHRELVGSGGAHHSTAAGLPILNNFNRTLAASETSHLVRPAFDAGKRTRGDGEPARSGVTHSRQRSLTDLMLGQPPDQRAVPAPSTDSLRCLDHIFHVGDPQRSYGSHVFLLHESTYISYDVAAASLVIEFKLLRARGPGIPHRECSRHRSVTGGSHASVDGGRATRPEPRTFYCIAPNLSRTTITGCIIGSAAAGRPRRAKLAWSQECPLPAGPIAGSWYIAVRGDPAPASGSGGR